MEILVIGIPLILVFVALSVLRSLDEIKQSQQRIEERLRGVEERLGGYSSSHDTQGTPAAPSA
ncbi:MAG TPA: hypothetical protein VFZ21_17435 [Gemmatimonadaceae bacterium]|jgi:hypothetical protein|nr:hypothetical protein [Gemmatimonadaceae bacterium]